MIILGIDPGIATTGFGIIEKTNNKIHAVSFGVILTPAKTGLGTRLQLLSSDLKELIKKYKPDAAGVEKIFFKKNVKTAIDVGHARGVVLLEISNAGIPVSEFTPPEIKLAVSGYGGAEKPQIQKIIQTILKLKSIPKPDDAADALAIALTLANSSILIQKNRR
jgi:crossover junction endodeoxyribonuclease RuvC